MQRSEKDSIRDKLQQRVLGNDLQGRRDLINLLIKTLKSKLENFLPMSGREFDVCCLAKYIAICLGLAKTRDLLGDNIS